MIQFIYGLVTFLIIFLASPVQAASNQRTIIGDVTCVGEGTARSFVRLNSAGVPISLGVILTAEALRGLPESTEKQHEFEYRLNLPRQAQRSGFNHIGLNWNPSGHYPTQYYGLPHFDFHFYLISQAERATITATEPTKQPEPTTVPTDYITEPGPEVAGMGTHWADITSPEFHGQIFTHTMLYGYHNDRLAFLEPMITKAFIESKPNVTTAIKQPTAFIKPGYYPTEYSVKYNEKRQEYIISLDGLTRR